MSGPHTRVNLPFPRTHLTASFSSLPPYIQPTKTPQCLTPLQPTAKPASSLLSNYQLFSGICEIQGKTFYFFSCRKTWLVHHPPQFLLFCSYFFSLAFLQLRKFWSEARQMHGRSHLLNQTHSTNGQKELGSKLETISVNFNPFILLFN